MSSLSRLYSFFGVGEELSKLSGLIATAEGHMQNEDFESAVRVLNQTNGEPHRIFSKVRFSIQFLLVVKLLIVCLCYSYAYTEVFDF